MLPAPAGSIHADAMVGERQVRSRRPLLHMASEAVVALTGCTRVLLLVTANAFCRVTRWVITRVLMRIVTGEAAQVTALAIAGAGHQTDGSESNGKRVLHFR